MPFLVLFFLLFGGASAAQAGEFCSSAPYNGVIDGDVLGTSPIQITIDMDCTFKNWPQSNPLTTTINFQTNDPTIYLIVFDNVWYEGNMACANIPHKLWVVNSEEGSFSGSCQDIMIPAETINKQVPASTATIGLPFTYTLTIPSMQFPEGAPSPNDIGSIVVTDDLTATGVDLSLVSLSAYYKGSGTPVPVSNLGDDQHLQFTLPNLAAGEQIDVKLEVVLNDTPANVPGLQFTNTATWQFSRWIDLNEDGILDANEFFNPLPGEAGISAPMTIVAPNLVVDKTSTATAINLGDTAAFTVDVQNSGGGDAWNAEITDNIPTGMCATDPTATLSAKIVQADGATLVKALVPGTDYSVGYSGCQLTLAMMDAAGPIALDQHLIITYQTQLDSGFTNDGAALTNVAGATQWFSADSTYAGRRGFARTLTDGTPGILDFQDNQTVTAALHGYYFEKTVRNVTSQGNPMTGITLSAVPGDTLHYKLRVFNVDQTINTITINDTLNTNYFDSASLSNVTIIPPAGYNATYSFDSTSGLLQIYGQPVLDVKVGGQLEIGFDITLKSGLANGTMVSNQAALTADGGFTALSDDPYINGVASPDVANDEDPTNVVIQVPGPLAKANTQSTATIGEQFEYIITVPATPVPLPLYDVQILDTLPANLRFVSARVVTGGAWTLSNAGTGNSLILEDTVTGGIDISANGQARIAITVELLNTAANQSSVFFNNSASYTYNRANGVDSTKLTGNSGTTPGMTVVEPILNAAKSVRFVSPAGKPATDPAMVGDVIEYSISIPNNGTSTAFDTNIVDTLPSNVALIASSATAAIGGVSVSGFLPDPLMPFGTTLIWGRGNGDGNLDIAPGQTMVLSYQVTVVDTSLVNSFSNSAYVDWTSLDTDYPIDPVNNPVPGRERTGAGCGSTGITLPNDYCVGPASITVNTVDTTSIAKSVYADSYAETPPSTADPIVRVGDTVTYDLSLNLQEYTTRSVVVEDTLPAGMELESFSINGGANFSYTLAGQPTAGSTGTLSWDFGDIINTPDGISTDDTLVIRYVAEVVTDAPTVGVGYNTSIPLNNQAKLSYAGGDPDSTDPGVHARLNTSATIEVRQPQMTVITKVDLGTGRIGTGTQADPYHVDIASDEMNFQLQSCNSGSAPAYNVQITDLLANELNEASLSAPVVAIGGTILAAGTDYVYTPPAGSGGTMSFQLDTPVNPGQCLTVDYNIGFKNNIASDQTWHNQAQLPRYESLPSSGRIYASTDLAQVWMTNNVIVQPLTKVMTSPSTATIGETVTYQITVPGIAMNASLDNVVVTDTLHNSLEYVGPATAVDTDGNPVTLTDASVAPSNVNLVIAQIPAGKQVIITLNARVANNISADAGVSFANTASYTYSAIPAGSDTSGTTSSTLTITEPSVTLAKAVNPTAPPSAGDVLHYTLTLTAASGANYSSAFDAALVDAMSQGLVYVPNSARVGGVAMEPTVNGASGTPQTLAWSGIDIPEGSAVSITYDASVLGTVMPGQTLINSATSQWTGIDGVNANERTGADGVGGLNDYVTGPVTASLKVSDNNSLTKTIIADTYDDAPSTGSDKILRVGDTATYRLTLKLGEGTNDAVKVQDVMPQGMSYDSLVGITPASGSSTLTYTVGTQPTPGATGTLTWNLGTVVNTPSNDNTPFDALNIEYKAKVLPDAGIAQVPTTGLTNTATLSYVDADGTTVVDPTRLVSNDTLTVRQPEMSPIIKSDRLGRTGTAANPLNVDVANDVMQFRLRSCNASGLAPAYSVEISDVLATQLDETSLTAPVVIVGGTVLTSGTGYVFTPPAGRGGTMSFVLNTPVNPGQCVTVDYNIGFHTDFSPNQTWHNSANLNEYWSLPTQSGQRYAPPESSQFVMTNKVDVTPLAKTLVSPAPLAEATIGETVTYQITVPGTAISGALDQVAVSDTLPGALEYVNATATLNGASLAVTPTQSGQNLTWDLGTIPAGQQAIITLTARVANNVQANAGTGVTNTASYTYTNMPAGSTEGSSETLTIIEPYLAVAKTVANVTRPGTAPEAGDILRYTVTLAATSGANFSSAFDADIVDNLSQGLAYVASSARVGGGALEPAVNGTPQTLTWAGIDIPEGTEVSVSYDVSVLNTVVAGQVLSNSVTVRWTGIDDADFNERTGADGIGGLNDYVATAAAPALTVPVPTLTFRKIVDKPVANPGDRLQYTIVIKNPTNTRLQDFALADEIERLNATPMFQPGSLGNLSVPAGASYTINNGTLGVTGLSIGANENLKIEFDVLLATNLKSSTVVLNQAELVGPWTTPIKSDDPKLSGAENPTRTLIPADGIVYSADVRKPLEGVTLTLRLASTETDLPTSCFVDPSQQNQVTPASGEYKFDLKFDPTNCPEGADYLIAVTAVPEGYMEGQSLVIPPTTGDSTGPYSVPVCASDAIPATAQCEAQISPTVPKGAATTYYLNLTLNATANQIFNNHIPVDPYVEEKISITKKSPQINVTRGQIVPYTITFKNTLRSTLPPLGVLDMLPAGFKYVENSSRVDETPLEPDNVNGRQLAWNNLDFGYNQRHTIKLLLVVGAGVSEGESVNRALVINTQTAGQFSEVATATVRVIPDPTFDCTDVIGKVFDDINRNGYQDDGEQGLAGVRVVTVRGLIGTTDKHGRFHITCAVVPDEDRGSNFILKLDDRSLPTGYRLTTENPRVQRATRGKMLRFNFGATIHHLVGIDISEGAFEPESTELRLQWQPRIARLLEELKKGPSVLRLSYLADIESKSLVKRRLKALQKEISDRWDGGYRLTIETEVFWRRGR